MNAPMVMLNSEIPSVRSGASPFYSEELSKSYIYFYHLANSGEGEPLYFASGFDFRDDGWVEGHWVPDGGRWHPVFEPVPIGFCFDKIGNVLPHYEWVINRLIQLGVPIFGHVGLSRFVNDKWLCYQEFPTAHALTALIDKDGPWAPEQFIEFFSMMDNHYEHHHNWSILKPVNGWESRGIYLVARHPEGLSLHAFWGDEIHDQGQINHALHQIMTTPYIIQARLDRHEGIPEVGLPVERHDVRFIFMIEDRGRARFLQTYTKAFPHGMVYIPMDYMPQGAFEVIEPVANRVAEMFSYGIFSVDVMRDVSGSWFLTELNDQVGLNTDFAKEDDVRGQTSLMQEYLKEMRFMRHNLHLEKYRSPI
ncbi:MAG: hypothetical protein NUW37_03750 [Planctomycetes bacterium]|nr:hypothetical protein [Planctomycetota bacterium]